MTKQQLLALLREAYEAGKRQGLKQERVDFIEEINRTNRVGDLELPELPDYSRHWHGKEVCPTCGYYCLGNGGLGCIDKPSTINKTQPPEGV